MVRRTHRPRRVVSPKTVRALVPFYRYDDLRQAYILRGVGQWVGPVLRPREQTQTRTPDEPQRSERFRDRPDRTRSRSEVRDVSRR